MFAIRILILALLPVGSFLFAHPVDHYFPKDRAYEHALFASEQECKQAQEKYPYLNCYQNMDFTSGGQVMLVVTDIMNYGTYLVRGRKVLLTMEPGEVVTDWSFTLSADEKSMVDDRTHLLWTLRKP